MTGLYAHGYCLISWVLSAVSHCNRRQAIWGGVLGVGDRMAIPHLQYGFSYPQVYQRQAFILMNTV